jgi:hypothetical protein
MSDFGDVVNDLARPTPVTIRGELEYDGSGPRPTGAPEETVYSVRLTFQRDTANTLSRTFEGDETTTAGRVWVSKEALAAVELERLPVAPPENADGPPGALFDWDGRRYEITKDLGWTEDFEGDPGFFRYGCAERGATPT